ncbi:MAG: cytochrome c [Blastocatellia bacterium]|nr:cytochrome c [Blastocatellia bacterium]
MRDDSCVKPYEKSPVFADGRSSRTLVPGTVAHRPGALDPNSALLTGFNADGQPTADLPLPVTAELLAEGKKQFDIYCAICHGADGAGKGVIVRRGFPPPPSYHIERLRRAPVGHVYDVITNGYGVMYSYADRIQTPEQRWAVAAYVRALQFSEYPKGLDATTPPAASAAAPAATPAAASAATTAPATAEPKPAAPNPSAPANRGGN